jgi:hypothetical protein
MKSVRSRSVLAVAGIALLTLALAALEPSSTTAAQVSGGADAPVLCFDFDTVAKGQFSNFGDFCFGSGPASAPEACPISETQPPCYACIAEPHLEAILRDACMWQDFWAEHQPGTSPPIVDFDRYVVVAVISGIRPDGCYGIEITQITGNGLASSECDLERTIHMRERVPCPHEACPDVVTNPYHFVKVCREFLPPGATVCFDHCRPFVPCIGEVACSSSGSDG